MGEPAVRVGAAAAAADAVGTVLIGTARCGAAMGDERRLGVAR